MALADNLVSYWNFDESSGDLLDQVGSNDGSVTGATQGATGKINDCYTFDGAGDYVSLGQPANLEFLNTTFSINGWFKTSNTGSRMVYFQNGWYPGVTSPQWAIYFQNDNTILFRLWDGTSVINSVTDTGFRDGNWHMVTAILDRENDEARIYIDGSLEDTQTITDALPNAAQDCRIGAESNNGESFNGSIDEIGVWARDISADLSSLYNSGSGLPYPFSSGSTVTPTALSITGTLIAPSLEINTTQLPTALSLSMTRGAPDPFIFKVPDAFELTSTLETDFISKIIQTPAVQTLSTTSETPQTVIVKIASLDLGLSFALGRAIRKPVFKEFSKNFPVPYKIRRRYF